MRQTRLNQGILLGKITSQSPNQQQSMLDILQANIVHSSAIEGKKLGMTEERPFPITEQTAGLAEIMLDVVENLDMQTNHKNNQTGIPRYLL
ncbi:hypothetical protein PMAL9190_03271 [Photobacterium malacitanum]|uniref:DUF4172 domain-containing protein n=1 Tax=Photobacterium malacitanum TaxID=2204294 RepID=A0A1Y6MN27_9GAMM|nr:hypothetical protein PMAL9190_03271 [Photobacterium malacitanum]